MKLRFPFQKRQKNDALTAEPASYADPAVNAEADDLCHMTETSEAESTEPVLELAAKVEQLEAKLDESERARVEQQEELRRYVDEVNRVNRENSVGSVRGVQSDYLSYSEVKEMTPEEVRKNFSRIVDSMGKWN